MQSAQRNAVRTLRDLRPQISRQSRPYASGASHGSQHGHQHAAPSKESIGTGFYIGLAAIPVTYLAYQATTSSDKSHQPYFTRYITDKYAEYQKSFERRNETHTSAMEQAAADRVLFLNETNRNIRHVDLKYPEQFNHGSPWNVPAGHGYANIDEAIQKYQREASDEQERKMRLLRDDRVPAEQVIEPITKLVR